MWVRPARHVLLRMVVDRVSGGAPAASADPWGTAGWQPPAARSGSAGSASAGTGWAPPAGSGAEPTRPLSEPAGPTGYRQPPEPPEPPGWAGYRDQAGYRADDPDGSGPAWQEYWNPARWSGRAGSVGHRGWSGHHGWSGHRGWAGRRPAPWAGSAGRSGGDWARDMVVAGLTAALPAFARRCRQALAGRRDPARRFARAKRRARRALTGYALLTVMLAWLTWNAAGHSAGAQLPEVLFGGLAVIAAVKTAGAGARVWQLAHTEPPRPAPAPLPRNSPAYPAMRRLADRERVLADLVSHLGDAAADTRAVAADAAAGLRALADRITAVDRARDGAPRASRPGLDAALAVLLQRLDDGVISYEALVVAAADAVSASATFQAGDPVLAARLTDATDALAGLAAGLRDVTPTG
jgi:hypothetical protein